MLPFIREDLNQFEAYTPHPGGDSGSAVKSDLIMDRLDTNESPYDLPGELKQKLASIYQRDIETNRYPDGSHEPVKKAIANYVNSAISEVSTPITADYVSVGNGSDELIRSLLIATCLNGSGSILVANPTFSMYAILAQTLGVPVVTVNRSEANFEIDLIAAKQAILDQQNPPIKVVFVVHPNSPTANALTEAELDWLRSLPQHILVVIDEAYFEFSQTTVAGEITQHPNWVILRTFSKAFRLASLRVGYAITSPELTTILEKVRLPYNLPSFSQEAALLALTHREELQQVIPEIIRERDRLWTRLANHPLFKFWPSDANFIYGRLKSNNSDQRLNQIVQALKSQGSLIRHTGGGLRITIGTPAENQRTGDRLFSLTDNY